MKRAARGIWALVLVVAMVALLACSWAFSVVGGHGSGSHDSEVEGAADALRVSEADVAQDVARKLLQEDGADSSTASFLSDLEKPSSSGADASETGFQTALAWKDERGLEAVAEDLLLSYAERSDAELLSSGYLDIKGRAWAAMLMVGSNCVDMLVVIGDEDDASCEVRAMRLNADLYENG